MNLNITLVHYICICYTAISIHTGLKLVVAKESQRITVSWDYCNGFVVIVRKGYCFLGLENYNGFIVDQEIVAKTGHEWDEIEIVFTN